MAVRTRSELRRIDQAQTVHDKRSFAIWLFIKIGFIKVAKPKNKTTIVKIAIPKDLLSCTV